MLHNKLLTETIKSWALLNEPVREKTNNLGSDQVSDTNRPVQSKKMVRGWKFWI